MNEQPLLWWIANIVGTLTFIAVVVDFVVEKRRIPKYVIVISAITFIFGATYGWDRFGTLGSLISVGFISAFIVFITCLSFIAFFSVESRKKNNQTENNPTKDNVE